MVLDCSTGAGAGFAALFVGFCATTLTGTLAIVFTGGRAFGSTDVFAFNFGRGAGLEVLAVGFCGFLFFLAMGVLVGD
ncbi:MAG: hypothetical protein WCG63_08110 [Opitutaceae bacterium]